jgi:hypothetical protein
VKEKRDFQSVIGAAPGVVSSRMEHPASGNND